MKALLHVRRPSGALATFEADTCDLTHGVFTATGRWRYASGRLGEPSTYTWPARVVVECLWESAQ